MCVGCTGANWVADKVPTWSSGKKLFYGENDIFGIILIFNGFYCNLRETGYFRSQMLKHSLSSVVFSKINLTTCSVILY